MMNENNLSVTKALIIINVVVFIVGVMVQAPAQYCLQTPELAGNGVPTPILEILGAYSWFTCFVQGEVWRLISYQFLHANFGHILFNMWALFFFGPFVEGIMGPRRFLVFYLLCGIAGALFSSALADLDLFGTLVPLSAYDKMIIGYEGEASLYLWQLIPLIGASASIYGVMVATAMLYPDIYISLIFPPVTLKLRVFALIIIAIATATILFGWSNAGGEAGHLGGILMGAILTLLYKRTRPDLYD